MVLQQEVSPSELKFHFHIQAVQRMAVHFVKHLAISHLMVAERYEFISCVCIWKERRILQIICKQSALLKNDKRKDSLLASLPLKDGSGFFISILFHREEFLLEFIFGAVCPIILVNICVGVGGRYEHDSRRMQG